MANINYSKIIEELRQEIRQIRANAERDIVELQSTINVLERKSNASPVKQAQQAKPSRTAPDLSLTSPQSPTEENLVIEMLRSVGGRGTAMQLYTAMLESGFQFNYRTPTPQLGYSIGLSKTRHTFKRVRYDKETNTYYI